MEQDISMAFIYKVSIFNVLLWLFIGFIGSFIFNLPILWGYFIYFTCGILFWLIHFIGHTKLIPQWYKAHTIGHHGLAYPWKNFLSESYVVNTYDKYDLNTFMYLTGAIIMTIVMKFIFGLISIQVLGTFIYLVILLKMEDLIHNEIHLKNSYLNKYDWFQKMRYIHYLHHRGNMKRNYAMKDFFIDLVTGNLILSPRY
jgi:hypothetical protein